MIRIYNYKEKTVKAVQFYVNYSEVERFTGSEITPDKNSHETLNGRLINQGDFIVQDGKDFKIVAKEVFRKEYEPA